MEIRTRHVKEISMEIKRYLLVQWLTESRFGKTKFGIPISLMSAGIGCSKKVGFHFGTRLQDGRE